MTTVADLYAALTDAAQDGTDRYRAVYAAAPKHLIHAASMWRLATIRAKAAQAEEHNARGIGRSTRAI